MAPLISVKLSSLTLDPKNTRRHPQRNLATIKASLARFGQVKPIVVDAAGQVVAGNGTLEAARELGWERINVVRTKLKGGEARAYAVADNRTAELAEWADDELAETLKALQDEDPALALATGFDEDEIRALLSDGVVEDEAPPPPVDPVTKRGDLWIMGDHRLLCGDSTKAEDVGRVMGGEKAGLMNTDPPYGIGFDNAALGPSRKSYDAIENDDLHDENLQWFLESCFRAAVVGALIPSAAWYLWHAHLTQGFFAAAAAAAAANVVLHRQIIWVKNRLILGRGQYHWKHEPCFMGWVKGNQPPDYGLGAGERTQTTIWEVQGLGTNERAEYDHASPKPVGLFTIPIVKHLKRGEVCYEPFAGSGPQFIAAEQLGRRCFGLEISPAYVDVCCARWANLTGRQPVKGG